MADQEKQKRKSSNIAGRLLHELKHNPELARQPVDSNGLDPKVKALRVWQSKRLAATYEDLLADRRFSQACTFFLNDVYAPKDFSQRDGDVSRIHSVLSKVFPPPTLRLLTESIELMELTYRLDNRLIQALDELGAQEITPESYAAAYRLCSNYDLRKEQIERIVHLLRMISRGAKLPLVGAALRLARGPALRAGYDNLYEFIERGYAAFSGLRSPQIFFHTIQKRELAILENLFAGRPNPFDY